MDNNRKLKVKSRKRKKNAKLKIITTIVMFLVAFYVLFTNTHKVYATESTTGTTSTTESSSGDTAGLSISLNSDSDSGSFASTLQMLFVLTIISLAPSILIMMTSFTRIIVVLHFVRTAIGTTSTPPNQVLVGLALFLTFFIMSPIFVKVNDNALKPLSNGEITQEEALEKGMEPIREFMFKQAREKDIKLFLDISKTENVETKDDIPSTVLIPAFIIGELRSAFIIGFLIYVPFIIIDMVVAATLMSMGMMMLPPTTISMPFKILLFILADGWNLIIGQVVQTFK